MVKKAVIIVKHATVIVDVEDCDDADSLAIEKALEMDSGNQIEFEIDANIDARQSTCRHLGSTNRYPDGYK